MKSTRCKDTQQRIICAAIHYNDGFRHDQQPGKITRGFVVTGRRHSNCYYTLSLITKYIVKDNTICGFLTSNNMFVDRQEAYQIAKDAGQIITNSEHESGTLTSEDLYED